jgi:hypothetical protein
MSYETILPQIFPYKVDLSKEDIRLATAALTGLIRTDVPFGSSFAVVSGIGSNGMLGLWLSHCSYEYLKTALPSLRDKMPPSKFRNGIRI